MAESLWNPTEHSDDENLKWCWLRSVEWGRWPIFISQPIAPALLILLPWYLVVIGVVLTNVIWAVFVRYNFSSVNMAFLGSSFALLKWITWPASAIFLFWQGRSPESWIAAFWPILIFILGIIPTTEIGRIQVKFMNELGYSPTEINPLA